MGSMIRRTSWVALALSLSACSTSMTQLQTARTLAPGQVQVQGGLSVPISTTVIGSLVDLGGTLGTRFTEAEQANRPITREEEQQALETGMALVLFHPGVMPELGGRIGVLPRLDVGLTYGGTLVKADAKLQLVRQEDALDLALVGTYVHHLGYGGSVLKSTYSILEFLQLGDYTRNDLGVGLLASGEWNDVFAAYGGVRYLASLVSLDTDLQRVESSTGAGHTELSPTLHTLSGTAGLMVGYKYVFLAAELTVARVIAKSEILGAERDYSGWIIAPSVGLVIKLPEG